MILSKNDIALFLSFLKIGAFTFGGGYAMIPLIRQEIVVKKGWVSEEDILDIVALAESTPGPVSINAATFVGSKIDGFKGGLIATSAVIGPSFLAIYTLSYLLSIFHNISLLQSIFFGIRSAILILIIHAGYQLFANQKKDYLFYFILFSVFIAVTFFNINVFILISFSALIGILFG